MSTIKAPRQLSGLLQRLPPCWERLVVALEMSTTMVLMSTPAGSGRETGKLERLAGNGTLAPSSHHPRDANPTSNPPSVIMGETSIPQLPSDYMTWPWSLCNGPACQQRCVPVSRLQDPGDDSDHGGFLDRWALSRPAGRAVHLRTTPAPVQTHRSPPRLGRGLEQASGAPAPVRNCPSVQFLTSTIRNDLESQPMRHDTCNCRNSMSTCSKHLWIELHPE